MTRLWSRRIGLVVVALGFVPLAAVLADHLRNVPTGQPLPPFTLEALDGGKVASADFADKVLILVYVSARQRQSEDVMASAHNVVGNIGHADLKLVYLSSDAKETNYFRELRDRLMAHEPFALDPDRAYYGKIGLIAFPTTILVSREGKLLHVMATWSRDYEYQLGLHARHALGEFDAAELAKRLATRPAVANETRDKAERHRSVAGILRKKGMAESAAKELEHAIDVDPSFADAVIDLADLFVSMGKIDQAEERIDALLAKLPQYHRAKLTLGLIKLKRGRLDEAEKLLTESLALNPDPVRANFYLGQLYETKGEHKRAMEHYREALKGCLNEP